MTEILKPWDEWSKNWLTHHSVLQDWVMDLPLRFQGTILTGIRGCDVSPKNPTDIIERHGCSTGESNAERELSAFLRFCCLNPADLREVDVPGSWFRSTPPRDWKPSQLGHFPLHWYSHVMHVAEIVGYEHPVIPTRSAAWGIYGRLVHNLHLEIESRERMWERLTEDRIATGTVVS